VRLFAITQQKCNAYDRKLLAIYKDLQHLHHMLEVCHFIIFTGHKLITCAFQQKHDTCSLQQFNHLDFVAHFTTDIRHISGQSNVVANALSHIESVTVPSPYDTLVHCNTATTSSKHSWGQPPPYGLRPLHPLNRSRPHLRHNS
jgi:hypothetical protein